MPGIAMSAPYWARPVTFGTPSGRIGRVPTHLNCFGEMSFIALLRHRAFTNLAQITASPRLLKNKTAEAFRALV
jgi:hypothetical protein